MHSVRKASTFTDLWKAARRLQVGQAHSRRRRDGALQGAGGPGQAPKTSGAGGVHEKSFLLQDGRSRNSNWALRPAHLPLPVKILEHAPCCHSGEPLQRPPRE